MKNIKYLLLTVILIGYTACNEIEDVDLDPAEMVVELPELTSGDADFSNYVAVGASFTAGFTDQALFIAAQENSFPNFLAQQFAKVGGGNFVQPLMNDNNGGLLFMGTPIQSPRFFFDGAGPATLPASPTTEVTNVLSGSFNNMGIPGAKSFHFLANGYGSLAGVPIQAANPYFARMASNSNASILEDALAQGPTFFTLSEVGGNDVLGYALSGGTGMDQTGNPNAMSYGPADITDPGLFGQVFGGLVAAMTQNGAKGVVTTVPDITSLANFTTIPHDPLDPTNPSFGPLIPTLNGIFGQLNLVYAFLESQGVPNATERSIVFAEDAASAVVIKDESLADLTANITGVFLTNPAFPFFVESLGLPAAAAPLVADLLGTTYGQTRQATSDDLLLLASLPVIGTVNEAAVGALLGQNIPLEVAGQFSVEGITLPLADQWVLLPSEQAEIAAATSAYNATIESVANSNPNVALADLRAVLEQAATSGYSYDDYTMTTDLVFGGLISLDGVHLTARGYGLMAREFLSAIDGAFGSNFIEAGATPDAGDLPTNYPEGL
ncbi:MAG: G-D-S-L family lipolytic protein [Flavobacteriaceae bacterium]|nr:G-D-S-L family lipolytic protein [Bacteroidia bacterium]NNL59851.1 G-D-S-L family lipolytic protein [Flavobacteriaceae bacterium]